jgi:hypothetical protein
MRKISKILILGLFFGAGLPLNFSVKIKCLPISGHCFSHKELISNIQIIRPALKYPQYSDIAGTVSISPKVARKSGMDDKMLLD